MCHPQGRSAAEETEGLDAEGRQPLVLFPTPRSSAALEHPLVLTRFTPDSYSDLLRSNLMRGVNKVILVGNATRDAVTCPRCLVRGL